MTSYHYVSKTINEYTRMAFVASENNIRITFDSNIKATETSFDLFNLNCHLIILYIVIPLEKLE